MIGSRERARVPSITTEQMREVDRLMVEEYGIVLLQMMENAGRNLARLAATLAAESRDRSVLVLAGKGNNGGGGMVAARHLSNMGGRVCVILPVAVRELVDVPAHQASILQRMGVELLEAGGGINAKNNRGVRSHVVNFQTLLSMMMRINPTSRHKRLHLHR